MAAAEDAILDHLSRNDEIVNLEDFAGEKGIAFDQALSQAQSLHGFEFVILQGVKKDCWELTPEGSSYCANGSPEVQVFNAVPEQGISHVELRKKVEGGFLLKFGLSKAVENKWLEPNKQLVLRKVTKVEDVVQQQLNSISRREELDAATIASLKKRKLIIQKVWKEYSVAKGPNYAPKRSKQATDLTREMLQNDTWQDVEWKDLNFVSSAEASERGHMHPLLKVRAAFRRIFVFLGFEEMPTNNYVESSFWNFDVLFQPQQHPARDSHDTFFLKEPSTSSIADKEYLTRVKQVHEEGGYGSRGYGYKWNIEEAEKNVLRTHTTAVSSRMLYKLAQDCRENGFEPKRYFSIDRVFRNEAVDRTHLAEFHQIEGMICDRGLTLGNLIGVITEFFQRLGVGKLRFRPAYNPYTAPSMEILSYHEQLEKWVEIGNSGMFRPEVLLPMGFPEDVRVLAWGLSLERPTMILYGIDNIRDLFGHKVDLKLIKENPICRLGGYCVA